MKIRSTDSPFYEPVQSGRFVSMEGNWYFMTREKSLLGPFASEEQARSELEGYLRTRNTDTSANFANGAAHSGSDFSKPFGSDSSEFSNSTEYPSDWFEPLGTYSR